jgi:titin
VRFTAGASNGAPVTRFTAKCWSSDGGATAVAAGNTSTAVPIEVGGVTTKKIYRCLVKASNSTGTSPASPASAPVTVGAPGRPGAPSVSRLGRGHVKVSFVPPPDNGRPITRFQAVCESANGGIARGKIGAAGPLGVKDLTPGRIYTCTVRATNTRGTGEPSAPSSAVTA